MDHRRPSTLLNTRLSSPLIKAATNAGLAAPGIAILETTDASWPAATHAVGPSVDGDTCWIDERLARVGGRAPTPSRADWPAYQAVGERPWAEGYAGVLFPSAARPAGRALCIFRPGHALPGMRAVPPPVRQSTPPAPPHGLRT